MMPEVFSKTGLLFALFVGIIFLFKWINVLNEYERAVTFWHPSVRGGRA